MPLLEEVTNQQETPRRMDKKEGIKWPAMHDSSKWNQFNDDLENILNSALHGGVERKIRALPEIIFALGMERFGAVESKSKSNAPAKPNRRQREGAQIRRELRSLRKQYKQRRKGRTTTTIETLRSRLKSLQNAESSTKRRRTRATKQTSFVQNSYNFTKAALEGEKKGALGATEKK